MQKNKPAHATVPTQEDKHNTFNTCNDLHTIDKSKTIVNLGTYYLQMDIMDTKNRKISCLSVQHVPA